MSDSPAKIEDSPITPSTVASSPISQFELWLSHASDNLAQGFNPREFCLSTATPEGAPSARIVLLQHVDERGFAFHTHYSSPKSQDLAANPQASLTFSWGPLTRSVRITGHAERVSNEESDKYFMGRPRGGLLAAWASEQSSVVGEGEVKEKVEHLRKHYKGKEVPRPDHWGGWRIVPREVEFWQGRMADRLHDRVRYRLSSESSWIIERLAP